jgi:tricorn protease-like protein
MRIIVESEKEKQDLVEVSKYLHDFNIYRGKTESVIVKRKNGKSFKVKKESLYFLDLESDVGNYLRHIYSTPEIIETKKNKIV